MPELFIVGKGAVGLLLAQRLANTHQVTLITRTPTDAVFFQTAQCRQQLPVKCLTWEALAQQQITISQCIVPVKSYQLAEAFITLRPHLSEDANVILSHNGMQTLTPITDALSEHQGLFFLSTSMGGWKPNSTTVEFTGPGQSMFGPCNLIAQQRAQVLFNQLIDPALPNAHLAYDIALLRWQKLCVNLAINPLSALTGLKNGRLRAPCYATQVLSVLNEACNVANHVGVPLKLSEELARAHQVMTLTAENFSSMAQDVANHRRTEINAMCGYIVELAQQLGVPAPHNTLLLNQVQSLHPTNK
ncbi:ketopantoate reductase family protein [Pseudoalteromonas sp. DL2-H2.2]|uniref:ketopantoate reductase family protein n=1 Tax=Pseudoalteromonas sp. DL2-H2.2 TaxID=2908889 RepID=UPI001F42A5C8|nr:ketopantoate reductase family protein [Pseudoalteromonas sp. DL2-H2.2]MCF2907691.1 ketopantoate reductase family protein [Pseudoalteromonas sp. DL2-H2.2]